MAAVPIRNGAFDGTKPICMVLCLSSTRSFSLLVPNMRKSILRVRGCRENSVFSRNPPGKDLTPGSVRVIGVSRGQPVVKAYGKFDVGAPQGHTVNLRCQTRVYR